MPLDDNETVDTDGDGIGNNADTDDDGDGVADGEDAFPLDDSESLDTDGDGIGNNADTDDDGDGVPDASDPNPLVEDLDSDADGVLDLFDEYPNNPANFTDTDGDGIYDFFDTAPADASIAKAVKFDLQRVAKAGVSESLTAAEASVSLDKPEWRTQIASWLKAVGDFLLIPATIAQDVGPDVTSQLASKTNLIAWSEGGSVLSDVIQSNQSMFVAEAVLHPNGGSAYVLTSPSIQRALSDGGRLELQVDSCQLYQVFLDQGGGFTCLLDENDPEIRTVLKSGVWRDDFLRAGISFRNDGVAVLESSQGPMVLQEDGSYQIFNEISREAPAGYVKNTEIIVWLDDDHIGIATNIFPESGGATTTYWTAFNVDTGEEVAEIEGTDFRIVAHDGSLYTTDGRVAWTGDGFQSDGQYYSAVQDVEGNLWDKGGVYGLTLTDQERGLQLSLGEEGTEGPNIYLSSGTGTRITYRDYAFDGDWVLSKYARHSSDTIKSVLGVVYEPNTKLFIDLPAPSGAFIKLYDPDLWYYLRSGDEVDDVAITYEVELASGGTEERQFVFPIEAIEDFAAFDSAIYDASTYANGYEILEQKGEGIALEGPNPEPEESAFCLFNVVSQQQRCAELEGYSVLRTDLENIRNNIERHYPASYYACPDNSCQAMPGVQNVVFGGEGLLAFFKDSADNQYYKASADLEEFMLYGDDALTVTPVVNGAGESEIVASSTSLVAEVQREVDVSRLEPFEYDFETNSITIDYGLPLAARIAAPRISVTLEGTGERIAVESVASPSPSVVEYALDESVLDFVGPVTASIDLIAEPHPTPMFFVKNSPLRHGWSDTRSITVGPPDGDDDGVADRIDVFPLDPNEWADTDGDGVGNNADADDDADGVFDTTDAFPLDPNETQDTDDDGVGNNADKDDDGDGVADISDAYPLDPYRGFGLGLSDVDGVRLSFSGVQVVDYIDGVTENTHYLDPSATNGVLDLSVPGPLDLSNLYDLVGSSNQGKAPVIRFALDSVPSSGSSGRATIITRIFDGSDVERNPGERVISATAVIDWASDGSKVTLSAPAQSSEVTLIDESGVGITRNFNNADSDVMSFTDSGPNTPSTLEMKLTSYINRNLAQVGLDPSGFFTEGDYSLSVEVIGLGMFDSLNEQFTRVEGSFSLTEDPIVYIYPLPRMVSSLHASSRAEAKPSRAVDRELCAEVLVKRDLGSVFGSGGGICWVDGRPDAEGPTVNDSDPNDGVNEIQILSVSNATGGNSVQDNGVAASPKPARIIVVDPVIAGEGGS